MCCNVEDCSVLSMCRSSSVLRPLHRYLRGNNTFDQCLIIVDNLNQLCEGFYLSDSITWKCLQQLDLTCIYCMYLSVWPLHLFSSRKETPDSMQKLNYMEENCLQMTKKCNGQTQKCFYNPTAYNSALSYLRLRGIESPFSDHRKKM